MRVTIVGSGDAFGTGGRGNTCFRVDAGGAVAVVDFGATALLGWNRLGMSTNDIDGVVLSHLHGDHFGGLPFLLLECQFVAQRRKELAIFGPPGTRARLETACEVFFPGMTANRWTFDWSVQEIAPGTPFAFAGFDGLTHEVRHPSGAPATGVRLTAGGKTFAYSGDTRWVDALTAIARDADLFMVECYSGDAPIPNHIDWPTLRANLQQLIARRIAVTHMGHSALAMCDAFAQAGLIVAQDGKIIDL